MIRSTSPATSACSAGAAPRYGTNWKRVPVAFWKNTPPTCCGLPAPAVPSKALSGLALSQAMNPARSLAGTAFLATIKYELEAMSASGSKSFSRS